MTKHIYLVDGNSIGHANHNGSVLSVGGFQVQAIFGFLRSLRALRQAATGDVSLQVTWDGKAAHRLAIYPEYKGNRKAMDAKQAAHKEAYSKQVPLLEKALEYLGIPQLRCSYLEADDLAAITTKRYVAAGMQVTLVSGDQDWLQLVSPHVTWFDPIRNRTVAPENFLEFTGYYTPAAFVQGKALVGDNSDNVPGIDGLGDKGAALFMAEWKSLGAFYTAMKAGTPPKTRKSKTAASLHPEQILASPEGKAIIARNLALMDMNRAPLPKPGDLVVIKKPADVAKFLMLCERLAFRSILEGRHAFLDTFGLKVPDDYELPIVRSMREPAADAVTPEPSPHADSAFAEDGLEDVPY